jgi:hypothetical protein
VAGAGGVLGFAGNVYAALELAKIEGFSIPSAAVEPKSTSAEFNPDF